VNEALAERPRSFTPAEQDHCFLPSAIRPRAASPEMRSM
jgi:hypothetical protein